MSQYTFYIASHFFNRGGYLMTEELVQELEKRFDPSKVSFYVPHRNDSINDKKGNDSNIDDRAIYRADADWLTKSDGVIACLDGVEIDSGVAAEILGIAEQNKWLPDNKQKIIIGYTTDMRRNTATIELLKELQVDLDDKEQVAKALDKIEQHKQNYLYRNLMITGACRDHGRLITGYATKLYHIDEIEKTIREFIENREDVIHEG